ncbi:MAG TPA: hypothetical protein GXX34_07075 [Clostridia bacterium]|nr:hypothetical protein [Clostridia bacterium]
MNKKAFLTALLTQLGEVNGKKSLHKLVYLARAFGLETGYSFRFHYYGPYSDALASDFEYLLETNQVKLLDNTKYKYGLSDTFTWKASLQGSLTTEEQGKINKLIETFGNKTPHELELYATIYFIDHHEKYVLGNSAEEDLSRTVLEKTHNVKPKYRMAEIKKAYDELERLGLLYQLPHRSSGH